MVALVRVPRLFAIQHHFHVHPVHYTRHCRAFGTADFDARKGDRERVVILGSGWGGYGLSRQVSGKRFQTLVVSPRSYFAFTPLLNSTAVGTLEFRNALEPIRNRRYPNIEFIQGWADDMDLNRKTVTVEEGVLSTSPPTTRTPSSGGVGKAKETGQEAEKPQGRRFKVNYDKLVIAVGCYSHTFGTKGVKENAYFLKDVGDARRIRKRVLECFEIAALPTTEDALKRHLLNFAIIGGGPTGMEFGAELSDLVKEDMRKLYPTVAKFVRITVYDVASKVLGMFDESLAEYAMKTFRRENIMIKTEHHVEELRPGLPNNAMAGISNADGCYTLKTKEDDEVGIGMCVWATGNMMNPFVEKAVKGVRQFPEASTVSQSEPDGLPQSSEMWMIKKDPKTNAIIVDDHLRIQLETASPKGGTSGEDKSSYATTSMKDVFAIGDNAVLENTELPATAQTANQQAMWLGKRLNKGDIDSQAFSFNDMGVMTYLGNAKGLVQTSGRSGISGRTAWLIWRGAYLTMSVSWRNRILIPWYWFLNWAFGRDISRF